MLAQKAQTAQFEYVGGLEKQRRLCELPLWRVCMGTTTEMTPLDCRPWDCMWPTNITDAQKVFIVEASSLCLTAPRLAGDLARFIHMATSSVQVTVEGDISNPAHLASVVLGCTGQPMNATEHCIAHVVDSSGHWPTGGLFGILGGICPSLPKSYARECRLGSLVDGGCLWHTVDSANPVQYVALLCCMKLDESISGRRSARQVRPELLDTSLQQMLRHFAEAQSDSRWLHAPRWVQDRQSSLQSSVDRLIRKHISASNTHFVVHQRPRRGAGRESLPQAVTYAAHFAKASAAASAAARDVARTRLVQGPLGIAVQQASPGEAKGGGACPTGACPTGTGGTAAAAAPAPARGGVKRGRHYTWEGHIEPAKQPRRAAAELPFGSAPQAVRAATAQQPSQPPAAAQHSGEGHSRGVPTSSDGRVGADSAPQGGSMSLAEAASIRARRRQLHRGLPEWWEGEVRLRGLGGTPDSWKAQLQALVHVAQAGGSQACTRLAQLRHEAAGRGSRGSSRLLFDFLRHLMGLHGI